MAVLLAASDSDAHQANFAAVEALPFHLEKSITKTALRLVFPMHPRSAAAPQELTLRFAYLADDGSRMVRWVNVLAVSRSGAQHRVKRLGPEGRSVMRGCVVGSATIQVPHDLKDTGHRLVVAAELGEEEGSVEFVGFSLTDESGAVFAALGEVPVHPKQLALREAARSSKPPQNRITTEGSNSISRQTGAQTPKLAVSRDAAGPVIGDKPSADPGAADRRDKSAVLPRSAAGIELNMSKTAEPRPKLDALIPPATPGPAMQPSSLAEAALLVLLQEARHTEWQAERAVMFAEMDSLRHALDEAQFELSTLRAKHPK